VPLSLRQAMQENNGTTLVQNFRN